MDRREFFKVAGAGGVFVTMTDSTLTAQRASPLQSSQGDRAYWVQVLRRLADPVLTNLANGTLKARMPVEQATGASRQPVTHLEAFGRLLAGLAPWLELSPDESAEGLVRARYQRLVQRALAQAVDPASPDFLNFTTD